MQRVRHCRFRQCVGHRNAVRPSPRIENALTTEFHALTQARLKPAVMATLSRRRPPPASNSPSIGRSAVETVSDASATELRRETRPPAGMLCEVLILLPGWEKTPFHRCGRAKTAIRSERDDQEMIIETKEAPGGNSRTRGARGNRRRRRTGVGWSVDAAGTVGHRATSTGPLQRLRPRASASHPGSMGIARS